MKEREEARQAAMADFKTWAGVDDVIAPAYGLGFDKGYEFGLAAQTETTALRQALEHYAEQCDDCAHQVHDEDGCTRAGCGCSVADNIARAALTKAEGQFSPAEKEDKIS